jgi:hypothetical protein
MTTTTAIRNDLNRTWGKAAVAHERAARALYRAEFSGRCVATRRAAERDAWAALCEAKRAAEAAG